MSAKRVGAGWVGSENWQFLLRLSTIFADVGRLGGSEKVQKWADVIWGWSLIRLGAFILNRMPTVVELFGADSRSYLHVFLQNFLLFNLHFVTWSKIEL